MASFDPRPDPLFLTTPVAPPLFVPLKRRAQRLGQILRNSGFVERAMMRKALERRRVADVPLGTVLTRNGILSPELIAQTLAAQWRLTYVDLNADPPSTNALQHADLRACLKVGCLPWRVHQGRMMIAISDPNALDEALAACGQTARSAAFVMARREHITQALETRGRAPLEAQARLFCPLEFSCRNWSPLNVTLIFATVCLLLLIASSLAPQTMFWAVFGWILVFNIGAAGLRLAALIARMNEGGLVDPPPRQDRDIIRLADHRARPVISILVPLHKEDKVLPALMNAIGQLDYPHELVDVKLLIEEHDEVTAAAIDRLPPNHGAHVIRVPDNALKTKPRALNYGLPLCRGEIIGIFDAEDRPRADQLLRVVEHLWHAPPDVAAVQARLDFYNAKRNWMARIFTLEYAIWFNVLMRGMRKLEVPIPLGGTSVYFRRSAIEELGGWDAHNVTEDAELGMRIARKGLKTEMIPSVTMEEANARVIPWIKQRSRWIKGYLITWAVHMREPVALWRDLGTRSFIAFQLLFLGGITSYLSGPILLGLWFVGRIDNGAWLPDAAPYVWGAAVVSMIFGQVVMLGVAVLAASPADKRHLLPWIITAPIYWQIGAFAALKAVAEMFYKPFYWDKTSHGDQSDQTTVKPVSPMSLMDTDNRPGASMG